MSTASIETATADICKEAEELISAWDAVCEYYDDTSKRFQELSERYESYNDGQMAYHLQDPVNDANKFYLDHARKLIKVAESFFGVGSVKLDIDINEFAEALGVSTIRQEELYITEQAASKKSLRPLWKALTERYADPTMAKSKASRDLADTILKRINGFKAHTYDGHEVVMWPIPKRIENLDEAFVKTKKYATIKISNGVEAFSSLIDRTEISGKKDGTHRFALSGTTDAHREFFQALAGWASLFNHAIESDLREVAKNMHYRYGFDIGGKIVDIKDLRIAIRKSCIEIAFSHDLAANLQQFLIGWANDMNKEKYRS